MRTSFRPLPVITAGVVRRADPTQLRRPSLLGTPAVIALALLTAPLTSGCELFVHFDRSRINADTATIDGGTNDAGTDSGRADANMPDTAVDVGIDAFAAPDTGVDADQPDVGTDGGTDGGTDANLPDTGMDGGCVTPATDCPAPSTCSVAICSGGGCSTTPAGTTVHCGTGGSMVCDGAGTCVECNVPADCGTSTECAVRTCTSHVCGVNNLGTSHSLAAQTPGDCQRAVCNGSGGTTSVDDMTDLPTPSTSCENSPACTGSPLAPSFTPATTGTACSDSGGHVCGDTTTIAAGTCVDCNTSADCTVGTCNTTAHTCS